jgi:hypothetical protein
MRMITGEDPELNGTRKDPMASESLVRLELL